MIHEGKSIGMQTLDQSVIASMDGEDPRIVPFLPYILQDIWEIGTNRSVVLHLIREYASPSAGGTVLDLGCGKGAVIITVAQELGLRCHGIDAMGDFIEFARMKSTASGVDHLCTFETGDIREKTRTLPAYSVIVLGSIGPVFGDLRMTLTTVSSCLEHDGIIILDDGYVDDDTTPDIAHVQHKAEMLQHIRSAGMDLVAERIAARADVRRANETIFSGVAKRCRELLAAHPDKSPLFEAYILKQEEENMLLENSIVCSTMVLRRSL